MLDASPGASGIFDGTSGSNTVAVVAKFANGAEVWYCRGLSLSIFDQHTEAVASYDKVIAINPNYSEAWFSREIARVELEEQTPTTPLSYAPIGAIVLIAGIAVLSQRRAL